ncbi:hypothetical protein PYW08_007293 [Mythimna loreyi]|uniref:Uncharacterized protein n=1 Tax=Mythimna loreyi TaxID=667449 RepID=A0ACC2RBT5_9NEOP|nr:hypothetical protein PYW08_007293 [Mythimna loreyi]
MSEEEKQPCLNDAKVGITVVGSESEENAVKEINCKAELLGEEAKFNDETFEELEHNEIVDSVSEICLNENKDDDIESGDSELVINETKKSETVTEDLKYDNVNNELDSNVKEVVLKDIDDRKHRDNVNPSEVVEVNEELSEKEVDNKTTSVNNSESNNVGVESNVDLKEACDESSAEDANDGKGWRKPKSRTVMPGGSVAATRSPHAHEPPDNRDDETLHNGKDKDGKKKSKNKEDVTRSVLIEGVLFRARYLGSTQLACEGQPTKATRMLQAEEAVSRIKAPEGENQPSTEVDLFISTEKIMVLNTELKEIMMDHALRTISYIADIGDLVVLMARRRFVPHENDSDQPKLNRTPKMICHVFESEEAQFIAQSIGQAFQVAYMEFLKANGIEDHSFVKEMDYQEVLNSQEIFGDELQMFAKKELQKEVVVPKTKGEILGVVVVESGWGSMLPTVVIANLAPAGAAARCGQLNIGDQIIAINGVSLVGLPLSTCQTYIKNSKNQTVVKLTVVPCAPVVEVKIKRPDTKYQLGFSVQNGVICSLLRGGIAERGGVRVGHRIIEINSQSVVAVPHERIVNLLATSVGEILMKTMPTSMFRLLTGQENPVFI